ncbi:MAG TPA: hypothetical protein VNA15_05400 [Candidatus Angelobacter sp.]|nr:hypothetical protein [Candidatus Angelobacter sp.]
MRAQLAILLRDPAVFFERFLDKTELFSAVGRDRFMKQKRIPIENFKRHF